MPHKNLALSVPSLSQAAALLQQRSGPVAIFAAALAGAAVLATVLLAPYRFSSIRRHRP